MFTLVGRYAKALAPLWLLLISVLFFLPGTALPKDDFYGDIYFDKWVHAGFFALLFFLWRFYFPQGKQYSWLLLAFCLVYGIGVEVVQHTLVQNRSFDLGDVAADMAGAVAAHWLWGRVYKKNRPL